MKHILDHYSMRVKVGIVLLMVLFVLLSTISLLIEQITRFDLKSIGKDEITINEERLEGLKRILPSHEIVGYVSDEQGNSNAEGAGERYFQMQYALSPVIVDYTTEHQLVVGNFTSTVAKDEIYKKNNLFLINDFGNGVVLLGSRIK